MKIVVLDAQTLGSEIDFNLLSNFGNYEVYQLTQPEERLKHIADAEIVITNKVLIDKYIIDNCSGLKLVALTATGMNNVDLEYAKQKGIIVKNVAGYSTESVAQHTFALLLHLMHNNSYYDSYVKSGAYVVSETFTHIHTQYFQLKNKTWGIIGLGAIGKRVAEIAKVFGCNIIYFSTSGKNFSNDYKQVSLPELLSTADVISIHAPLNENTRNLISENEFSLMKPTSYLVNVGRGGIVNEMELAIALDSELLAGAALDVLEKEPIDANNPLLHIQNKHNLFITPHIAWVSQEAMKELWNKTLENVKSYLKI
ncbi:MAG: D-2-hydroxyacid dehydrogenase [Bacteroidales bacterium]|nr:D-2-hydroxyacid dehydrogenase [Bacteroidales bacterium]